MKFSASWILSRSWLLVGLILIILPSSTFSENSYLNILSDGKKYLQSGEYFKAEENFTKILPYFEEIGDYILFWRAESRFGLQEYNEAMGDLEELKKKYPRTPLMKEARKLELEIAKTLNLPNIENLYESYIADYPDEHIIKFEYAKMLKEKNNKKAKKLLKEVFLSVSSFADKAEGELSPEDLTADDLLKKGRILNNAYLFKKAEKYLREAFQMSKSSQKSEILSALGYCLFMQKRYSEAAEILKKSADTYWRARALIRAKDFATFESEMPVYMKNNDTRMADVFINYANIKRRAGYTDEAIKILQTIISKYPEAKEEILWNMAWIYYISEEYEEARKVLKQLYSSYGKPKYFYWLDKVNEIKGIMTTTEKALSFIEGDLYSYLLFMKEKVKTITEPRRHDFEVNMPNRLDILIKAGFREETLRELKITLRQNRDNANIPYFSKLLNEFGDYPTSVRLISTLPNRFIYHELLFPQAYRDIVFKASAKNRIDPNLVFAIMREESRFDRFAISPAGALGLMQLMPNTARREGRKLGIVIKNDSEIFSPEKNILIGSSYLKNLIDEFGNIVFAIAAYNAGEKVVWSWIKNNNYETLDEFIEDIPYNETKKYVQRVLTSYFEYLRKNKALTTDKMESIIKIRGGRL